MGFVLPHWSRRMFPISKLLPLSGFFFTARRVEDKLRKEKSFLLLFLVRFSQSFGEDSREKEKEQKEKKWEKLGRLVQRNALPAFSMDAFHHASGGKNYKKTPTKNHESARVSYVWDKAMSNHCSSAGCPERRRKGALRPYAVCVKAVCA